MSDGMLIRTFREQLENQSTTLAEQHERQKRGDRLIWWYFLELEGFTPQEIEDVYCDGGGDLGIDAIWIDDRDVVHIYSFKNPEKADKTFPVTGVDRLLSGLRLIFDENHDSVSSPELKEKIDAIYQIVPTGYVIHIVTSGQGIGQESERKLQSFVDGTQTPSKELFQWQLEDIVFLQRRFYQKNLPSVEEPIEFATANPPHLLESGSAECYFFSATGQQLASLYASYGERLLQRNIRADQGNTATNRAIFASCTGDGSNNFIHFNNGVSFLADSVNWDPMRRRVTLTSSQIVNGGQTVRMLRKAQLAGTLKSDVIVPVRAISSGGDRQFGSDVTVNQNNQNSMQTGFLRSNDPAIVQLANSLASIGFYLERRKNELKTATEAEVKAIEAKIRNKLAGRVIRLKEGTQAYVATYFRQPEIAKKNPKKMFQSQEDSGYFDRIFSTDISAEKITISMAIMNTTEQFVAEFKKRMLRKRRRDQAGEAASDQEYRSILGDLLVDRHPGTIDQAIPQSAIFLAATTFQDWVDIRKLDPKLLPDALAENDNALIKEHLLMAFDFARDNPMSMDRSWPTMMKSNKFVAQVVAYIKGIRKYHRTT